MSIIGIVPLILPEKSYFLRLNGKAPFINFRGALVY